jgi:hypothetical protein
MERYFWEKSRPDPAVLIINIQANRVAIVSSVIAKIHIYPWQVMGYDMRYADMQM